ncbi:MAG: LLM class flavin-dependent oxidoreductase, partial [Dehalococcoidia bacterium]
MPQMESAIQFHLPTYNNISVPELISLGQMAKSQGVNQLWVTDNLQSRNSFVVLAALAASIKGIKLGTAITVQYFRNPVDLADSVATISEIMDGTEFSIGLARGNAHTPQLIRTPRPISTLRETAQSLRRLLDGEPVTFADYPALASYFNFNPDFHFQLNFQPKIPLRLYCGGNGPLSLAVGGQYMDGLIIGGQFQAFSRSGNLPGLLQHFDNAAAGAGKPPTAPKVAEIKISVSRDRAAAREFVKHSAARRVLNLRRLGYTGEDLLGLGVEPGDLDRFEEAYEEGANAAHIDPLVTDGLIDAIFVAGDPGYCRERMVEVRTMAAENGCKQMM